jgi:NADH-quinone oxidoreductase subunit K
MFIVLKEILVVTTFLFLVGTIGVALNRKNIIITLMSIELMLLAVNLNYISFSVQLDDIVGQIFVLFILTIAATESSVGLAVLSTYHSTKNTVSFETVKNQIFSLNNRKRRDLNPQSST